MARRGWRSRSDASCSERSRSARRPPRLARDRRSLVCAARALRARARPPARPAAPAEPGGDGRRRLRPPPPDRGAGRGRGRLAVREAPRVPAATSCARRRRDVATRRCPRWRALLLRTPSPGGSSWRQSAEAERACDDRVLGRGIGADDYATYLLDAARSLAALPQPLSVLSVTGRLESRMLAILDPRQRRTTLSRRARAAVAAASLACVASAAAIDRRRPCRRSRSAPPSPHGRRARRAFPAQRRCRRPRP